MKIIFLDIDGVLNSENHGVEMYAQMKANELDENTYYHTWDLPYEDTLLPLKKIVDTTGAKIVLSSSWRLLKGRREQLNKIFKPYGFQIFDVTTHGVPLQLLTYLGYDPDKCYDAKYRTDTSWHSVNTYDRGAEIAYWLFHHPSEIESFVILDDEWFDIRPYFPNNLVQTDFHNWGLTMDLADKAIEILNNVKKLFTNK